MKKNNIYFVEEGDFWMLGRCLEEPGSDPDRCPANTIRSDKLIYTPNSMWCFQDSRNRKYREATYKEKMWYEECERQQKFIPENQINYSYDIY